MVYVGAPANPVVSYAAVGTSDSSLRPPPDCTGGEMLTTTGALWTMVTDRVSVAVAP